MLGGLGCGAGVFAVASRWWDGMVVASRLNPAYECCHSFLWGVWGEGAHSMVVR